MQKLKLLILLILLVGSTSAAADDFFAVTPSGTTEMFFAGKASDVIGTLSGKCMDAHWTVVRSSTNELVCEAPLSTGQSFMGQLLLGNSYSTPPRRFFRFTVIETKGIARVQPSGWMETQMAFGQMKRVDFSGPKFHNSITGFMASAGGKFPVGTTFPNHVVMGFQGENVQIGKQRGLRVKEVTPDTPAARAKLQAGDVITRIAGKKFKDDDEYLDALAKAAKTATYKIDLTRAGQEITITLDREFRPSVTEAVEAKEESSTSTSTPSASIADELTKLSKLRDQGILTEAEFEAQKRKLLAQ